MRWLRPSLVWCALAATVACGPRALPPPVVGVDDSDRRMDFGLERLEAHDYQRAAATFYGVYAVLPESDLRRDLAAYDLAKALIGLGFVQAGVEHYVGIVEGRHVPDLVNKSLVDLVPMYTDHRLDRDRLVESVLYGNQYSDLPPGVTDFVEYQQALTDIRHGFVDWGRPRMEALAATKRPYSYFARYTLAVEHVARKDDDVAAETFVAIAKADDAPAEVRDDARLALARILYEKKKFEDAWKVYSEIDTALRLDDAVIIEKSWDLVSNGNQQRALGLLIGLGAPAFRDLFAPERDLIRALALRRLCQYRSAHVAVRDFRSRYGQVLKAIRAGVPIRDVPIVRKWSVAGDARLAELDRLRVELLAEQVLLPTVGDKPLRAHLATIYSSSVAHAQLAVAPRLEHATERVADELLRVEEQMNLIDYEVGVGLFKSGDTAGASTSKRVEDIPYGSQDSYFRFDGEYWSDEIGDYTVFAEDRCVR
jgi:hypothetical protein